MKLYIEANIGAGKTTFINKLEKYFENNKDIVCLREPVDEWINLKDSEGNNILNYFYKDTKRWSYTFQMNAFMTRIQSINNKCKNEINFIERSIYTDRNCFALLCKENGSINDIEWGLYQNWFDWLNDKFNVEASGYIYIKTSPETCYERIKKRDRKEESDIPLEYLKQLDCKHEEWMNKEMKKDNVLIIDGEQNFENDDIIFLKIIKKIELFINKLTSDKYKKNIVENISTTSTI